MLTWRRESGEINRMKRGVCNCLYECLRAGGVCVCVCGASLVGGLLAPVARARRKRQHQGLPRRHCVEEMLPPVFPHFIHQHLARAIFSPPLALHLCRSPRVYLSLFFFCSTLCPLPPLFSPPPPPPPPPPSGRALYKHARDSASSFSPSKLSPSI